MNCVQDNVIPGDYLEKNWQKDIDNYANLMLSSNAHLRKRRRRTNFESLRDDCGN